MAKGGNFELKIAKILSLWFSKDERDDLICKTDSSGGRATVRTQKNKKTNIYMFGDLKHSDESAAPIFDTWSIECKTGYRLRKTKKGIVKWDILDLIDSTQKEPTFEIMWGQCKKDAVISNREPILIFGRDLRTPCIAMRYHYFNEISEKVDLNSVKHIDVSFDENDISIFGLKDFLGLISPGQIFYRGFISNDKNA